MPYDDGAAAMSQTSTDDPAITEPGAHPPFLPFSLRFRLPDLTVSVHGPLFCLEVGSPAPLDQPPIDLACRMDDADVQVSTETLAMETLAIARRRR